jgi:hypothetical protein
LHAPETAAGIPWQVTTAPVYNAAGEVIGGVEMFRDVSSMLVDLKQTKQIQSQNLELDLIDDPRGRFSTFFTPFEDLQNIADYIYQSSILMRIKSSNNSRSVHFLENCRKPRTKSPSPWLYVEGLKRRIIAIIDAASAHITIPDQIQAHHGYHNIAFLIYHLAKGVQHASVRFAAGRFHFVHSNTQGKFIAGAHRIKPAQFIHSRASQAGWARQVVFHKHAHK